jgi:hypothetical protein
MARVSTFRQLGEEGLVQLAEALAMHLKELLKNINEVPLDRGPASKQKLGGEPVRPWCLACRQSLHRVPDLVSAKGFVKVVQVLELDEGREVECELLVYSRVQKRVKVCTCSLSHVSMGGEYLGVRGNTEDSVLLSPVGTLMVVEGGVGVSLLKIGNTGALSGDCSV